MPARDDDWRITDQESYLTGVTLVWRNWSALSEWDHDHCTFCWTKFMAADFSSEQREWRERHPEVLTAGYTMEGAEESRRWICPSCVEDFRERFGWSVVPPDNAG